MRSPPAVTEPPSSSTALTFWHWNSPLPYLFIGLGLMILLITAALVILACSFRKRASSPDEEKAPPLPAAAAVSDNTPKIVVIMAGDDNPTHLAVPMPPSLPASRTCACKL